MTTQPFAVLHVPYIPPIERLMVIGNSITYKTPEMETLGWGGSHGVAATFPWRDWVHQTWAGIAARQALVPDVYIVSIKTPTMPPQVPDKIYRYQPNLIVIQWGEVMPPEATIEEWKAQYAPIGTAALTVGSRTIAVGIWANRSDGDLRHVNQEEAITQIGMEYVQFDDLHTPETEATADGVFTHPAICWHPGDLGMRLIAERVLAAIQPQTYLPVVFGRDSGGSGRQSGLGR